jgi:SAM-dependent methyltransferase
LDDGRYDAKRYWADRHRSNRHGFRGVGDIDRSDEENIKDYMSAVGSITQLFSIASFNPTGKKVLDVGCGNGFWTGVFQEWDVASYTGVDITDTLFDLLRERHPHLSFMAGDLEQLPLDPGFELITMIDVTQHVTEDVQLRRMLMRLRILLAKDGVFIVTFWNQLRPQENFYEIFRLFSFYTQALDGMAHTQPIRFRDKFVAAFFHQERHLDQVSPKSLPKASILEIARRIVSA